MKMFLEKVKIGFFKYMYQGYCDRKPIKALFLLLLVYYSV